jgi:ATP-dependent DNA ligase
MAAVERPWPGVRFPGMRKPLIRAVPMEAASADRLPEGAGWWFEPKWDGFRCLAFKAGDRLVLQAKSGKPLTRFFPEVAERLAALPEPAFALDGELLIAVDGRFSFEALQLRLHPAESRIRRLAAETPATLALFDMLVDDQGRDLRDRPLAERHAALTAFPARHGDAALVATPGTEDCQAAQGWLSDGRLEGVVAERLDGPYREGERAMVKVKRARTADCVVGGFRYASQGGLVGSLLLRLYDDAGRLDHVGHTSGFAGVDRAGLTRRLEGLRGGEGFTGSKPGAPSRWSTERSGAWEAVRPEIVVEVSFDHVSEHRFRHGTRLIRLRPDKSPRQCRMDQIA